MVSQRLKNTEKAIIDIHRHHEMKVSDIAKRMKRHHIVVSYSTSKFWDEQPRKLVDFQRVLIKQSVK